MIIKRDFKPTRYFELEFEYLVLLLGNSYQVPKKCKRIGIPVVSATTAEMERVIDGMKRFPDLPFRSVIVIRQSSDDFNTRSIGSASSYTRLRTDQTNTTSSDEAALREELRDVLVNKLMFKEEDIPPEFYDLDFKAFTEDEFLTLLSTILPQTNAAHRKEADIQELPHHYASRWDADPDIPRHYITSMYMAVQDAAHTRAPRYSPVQEVQPNLPVYLALPMTLHPRHKDVYLPIQPLPPLCDDPSNAWFYINDARRHYDEPPTALPVPRLIIRGDSTSYSQCPVMKDDVLVNTAHALAGAYNRHEIMMGLAVHALIQLLAGSIKHSMQIRDYIRSLVGKVRRGHMPRIGFKDMAVTKEALEKSCDERMASLSRNVPPDPSKGESCVDANWVMDYDEMKDVCTDTSACLQEPLLMYTERAENPRPEDDVIIVRTSGRTSAPIILYIRVPGRFRTTYSFLRLITEYLQICRKGRGEKEAFRKDPRGWEQRKNQEIQRRRRNDNLGSSNRSRFARIRLREDRTPGNCAVCGADFKSYFDHIRSSSHYRRYEKLLEQYNLIIPLQRSHTLFSRRQAVMAQLSHIAAGVALRTGKSYEEAAEAVSDCVRAAGGDFRLDSFDTPHASSPTCRSEDFQRWRETILTHRHKQLEQILSDTDTTFLESQREYIRKNSDVIALAVGASLAEKERGERIMAEEFVSGKFLPTADYKRLETRAYSLLPELEQKELARKGIVSSDVARDIDRTDSDNGNERAENKPKMRFAGEADIVPAGELYSDFVSLAAAMKNCTKTKKNEEKMSNREQPSAVELSKYPRDMTKIDPHDEWSFMIQPVQRYLSDMYTPTPPETFEDDPTPPPDALRADFDEPVRRVVPPPDLIDSIAQVEIGHLKPAPGVEETAARLVQALPELEAVADPTGPHLRADLKPLLRTTDEDSNEIPFVGKVIVPPFYAPPAKGAEERAVVRRELFAPPAESRDKVSVHSRALSGVEEELLSHDTEEMALAVEPHTPRPQTTQKTDTEAPALESTEQKNPDDTDSVTSTNAAQNKKTTSAWTAMIGEDRGDGKDGRRGASGSDELLLDALMSLPTSLCQELVEAADPFIYQSSGAPSTVKRQKPSKARRSNSSRRLSIPLSSTRPHAHRPRSNSIPGPIVLAPNSITLAIASLEEASMNGDSDPFNPAPGDFTPLLSKEERSRIENIESGLEQTINQTELRMTPSTELDTSSLIDAVNAALVCRVFGSQQVLDISGTIRSAVADAFNGLAAGLNPGSSVRRERNIDPLSSVMLSVGAEARVLANSNDWHEGVPLLATIESRTLLRNTPRPPLCDPEPVFNPETESDADFSIVNNGASDDVEGMAESAISGSAASFVDRS